LLLKTKTQFAAVGEDTLLLKAKTKLIGCSDFVNLEVQDIFLFTCTKKLLAWDYNWDVSYSRVSNVFYTFK